jgi:hypothetical protein
MSEIAVEHLAMPPEDEPSRELTTKDYELQEYYKYLDRIRTAEANERQKWASHPEIKDKALLSNAEPWEIPGHNDAQRQQMWTGLQIDQMNKKRQTFSQAAVLLASSHEHATYYDDVKWGLLGDSKRLGQFPEISPSHNDTPFQDVQHNYDQGMLNAFAGNTIIHMRETSDPTAKTRSQKLFVVAIDLMSMSMQRLYVDDKPQIESLENPDMSYDEVIPLTSRTLQSMENRLRVQDDNPLKPYLHELFENQATELQAQLVKSTDNNGWQYKPEGYAERSKLHPIERLDYERGVLWALGQSLGHVVTSRGAIIQSHHSPEITQ